MTEVALRKDAKQVNVENQMGKVFPIADFNCAVEKESSSEIARSERVKRDDKYLKLFLEYKKGSYSSQVELVTELINDVARVIANNLRPFSGDLLQDDLLQEGYLAIRRALEKYDPAKGQLRTYVYDWVRSFMRRAIDEKTGDIHQKKGVYEERRKIEKVCSSMYTKNGVIDWEEVSKLTNLREKRLTKRMANRIRYAYLDAPVDNSGDKDGDFLGCFVTNEEIIFGNKQQDMLEQKELKEKLLKIAEEVLTPKEKQVLYLRYGILT